jgi:mannosyltransferase OCH1-like enzyme
MPDDISHHIDQLQKQNADVVIHVWDPQKCRQLIQDNYPSFQVLYDSFPYAIQQSDFSRYAILHTYGGVYADLDYTFTKPLRSIIDYLQSTYPNRTVFVNESPNRVFKKRLSNSLMIALRKHDPFWLHVMQSCTQGTGTSKHDIVMTSAGPRAIDRAYKTYASKDTVGILPFQLFNPCSVCQRGKCKASADAFAFHEHAGCWHSGSTKRWNEVYCNAWWIVSVFLAFCLIVFLTVLLARSYYKQQLPQVQSQTSKTS